MIDKKSKILIVGQGLAGTLISACLLRRGIEHYVVDNHHKNAATNAAAGLINPITGRRYVKSWMIDELLPAAIEMYTFFEELLDIHLINKRELIRSLHNPGQENDWESSIARPGYETYTSNRKDCGDYKEIVNEAFQYRGIQNAYQVNIADLISAYREYLVDKAMLITEEFDSKDINLKIAPYQFSGISFSSIIFCEGYRMMDNPYFNDLPLQPAKGEAFNIEIESFYSELILRDDIFLVPVGNNEFWTGSEYQWQFEDDQPTQAFVDRWRPKLEALLRVNYRIVSHVAGIRPSVKGRRPLIGIHHDYPHMILFNGLGTKGTSLGPYFANHLCDHLLNTEPLMPDVDIYRFRNVS
ncbi:MAG: FAD-binding oxidoreductase [Saprospiraceae bacterium]|nr:FAD-binding oxidoreductase [Saprospiraceae bacterium]